MILEESIHRGEGESGQQYRLRQLRDTQWCGNMKWLQMIEDIQIQNTRVSGSVSIEERSVVVLKGLKLVGFPIPN